MNFKIKTNFSYVVLPRPSKNIPTTKITDEKNLTGKDSLPRGEDLPIIALQLTSHGALTTVLLCLDVTTDIKSLYRNQSIVSTGINDAHQRRISPSYPRDCRST